MTSNLVFKGWEKDPKSDTGSLRASFKFASPLISVRDRRHGGRTIKIWGTNIPEAEITRVVDKGSKHLVFGGKALPLKPADFEVLRQAHECKPKTGEGGPA